MSNTIQIKHGNGTPPEGFLKPYELGFSADEGVLYIGTDAGIIPMPQHLKLSQGLIGEFPVFDENSQLSSVKYSNLIWIDTENNINIGDNKAWTTGSMLAERPQKDIILRVGDQYTEQEEVETTLEDGTVSIEKVAVTKEHNAFITRQDSQGNSTNYLIFDELSIRKGFTLDNYCAIWSPLDDGIDAKLIHRSKANHVWIGERKVVNQGNAYISVGGEGTGGVGRLYVTRATDYISSEDYSDIYTVYDELTIGNGFTLNNNAYINSYLSDGTKIPLIWRSNTNNTWVGGSTSSGSSYGSVVFAIGEGGQVLVYRADTKAYGKVLDYGFVAKNVWSGSCAVGGTFSIPNFTDYRFFIINLTGLDTSMLIMRRGNYLRGGIFYAYNGLYFECIRCNGNSSGTFTYNEGRSYSLTTSGATSNWGTSSSPAPNIVSIWGVL